MSRISCSPSYSVDYSESEEGDKEFSSESDSVASSLHEAPGPLSKHNKEIKKKKHLSITQSQLLSSFDDSAMEISDGKKMRSKSFISNKKFGFDWLKKNYY